ncbi:MAG: hypothetical protein QOE66_393 [Chloroflexota bacterium]|nr:hypothetical protein [Chloroflexota bacterium]
MLITPASTEIPRTVMRSARQPAVHRRALRSFGAFFGCVLLLALAAPIALAGEPHLVRPPAPDRDSPTPHFVTETNDTKWDDCEWASAAMLLEKWTGERVDRRALRGAANVAKGGSSFRDVTRGTDYLLNLHLRYSPGGGDPMTWRQLLARLSDGGGAVIEGAYSRMPQWFKRWDRKFAASGSVKSAHAVYVERYQPRRGRVWLMDPLGRDGYNGEWISVSALEYFSYTSSGLVHAMATPARLPPVSISKVRLGQPTLDGPLLAGTPTVLSIPIVHDPRSTRQPRVATVWVSSAWERVDPALPDGPVAPARLVPATPSGSPPPAGFPGTGSSPISPEAVDLTVLGSSRGGIESTFAMATGGPVAVSAPIVTGSPKGAPLIGGDWNLHTRIVAPTAPGRYRLTLTLRDRSGRAIGPRLVKPFLPMIVSVGGPYQATFDGPQSLAMGDRILAFGVTNTGRAAWVASAGQVGTQRSGPAASAPHVIADWLFADGHTDPAGGVDLDLAPGVTATVALPLLVAPSGAIALRLDLIGPDGGRFSEQGGRATIIPLGAPGTTLNPN